jgi:three-Cys-motif partner protein
MGKKDLHKKPFDESTVAKLEIFEDYTLAWIPVFVMAGVPTINIFDFFAGTGYDLNGVAGSPIRILNGIKKHIGLFFKMKCKVILHFNEYDKEKFALLKSSCDDFLQNNNGVALKVELNLYNEDFDVLFNQLLPQIKKFPSLVFLDQNGIKYLDDKYFMELESTKHTDFLYFVSASYFWRFGTKKEFKAHFQMDMEEAKKDPYKLIHRNLLQQLRKKIPAKSQLKLYPYSLKKGVNIHGIIFGASHPLAVDKFLAIAWKRNEINGEANFDIDDDVKKIQLDAFDGQRLTKLEKFKDNLKQKILSGEITNNFDAYSFTTEEGHIGRHTADCLKEMKSNGELAYDGISPCVTYDNVYKKHKLVKYIV